MRRLNKFLAIASVLFLVFIDVYPQKSNEKPVVKTGIIGSWPVLRGGGFAQVSNNGRFVTYIISNQPNPGENCTFVQSINGLWKKSWSNTIGSVAFSNDSKQILFLKRNDTLCVAELGGDREQNIPDIRSFKLMDYEDKQWLITQSKLADQSLVVKSLTNSTVVTFPGVVYYTINGINLLLLQRQISDKKLSVSLMKLNDNSVKTIWRGARAKNFIFSQDKRKIAFLGSINQEEKDILWYWDAGSGVRSIEAETFNIAGKKWELSDITGFSKDGSNIYYKASEFPLKKTPLQKPPLVDIWSYHEPVLQARQLLDLKKNQGKPKQYAFVFSLKKMTSTQLERQGEEVSSWGKLDSDNYILVSSRGSVAGDGSWNKYEKDRYSIISLKDSSKKIIIAREIIYPSLSPSGEYCIYFDPLNKNYISLDLNTGKESVLTSNIQTSWTSFERQDDPSGKYIPMGLAGWTKNNEALIYDQNDIFLVDLTGKKPAKNLTGGFGKAHQITFRIAMSPNEAQMVDLTQKLLLCAFNRSTKEDGFFLLNVHKNSSLIELTMQSKAIEGTDEQKNGSDFEIPVKARDVDLYIVKMESARESPNLFYTTDFKKYTAITNIYPERNYNWITAELVNWKTGDSILSQGILYKPQNFDPQKKYPLIITYYEKYSAGLHQFDLMPYSDGATIRIPEYVSGGYLVLVADINFKVGNPGKSACNSIVAAASLLAKEPWVDSGRIGLNGHSFGGYQTQYIVTHSNLFAAACANSGWSNFISASNRVRTSGAAAMHYYEGFKQRMGANMWERPDQYIQSSPIFQVHKVTTPLLMMNNKADNDVVFNEGVQFFIALRRLGKKVWMLQYDNEGHALSNPAAEMDLNIRMRQFFDFYLKGAQAPTWMVNGIPAEMKGYTLGYELMPIGVVPGANLLTPEEQKKVDTMQKRKPIKVEIE